MNAKKIISLAAALILALAMVGTAMAETIQPLPVKIDINHLDNRFVTTNIEYKGDSVMTLTLMENEQFDAEAVKAVQKGDIIISNGEETTVETVEWDGPDLYINRGTDKEMLFCDANDGTFEHVMEDDRVPQLIIGSMDQYIAPYMIMLDWVDAKTGESLEQVAVRSGDELLELLEKGDGPSFAVENVHILYDHYNQPTLIWRFYSPAQ